MGIDYGPAHRGIEAIFREKDYVLAKLSLPSSVLHTQTEFVLHPALMDSTLQATIGLVMGSEENLPVGKPALPFALEELKISEKCTPVMWARISHDGSEETSNGLSKVDIDLCDETGKICVQLKGLLSRALEGDVGQASITEDMGTLMLEPVWQETPVTTGVNANEDIQHVVILCEVDGISGEDIEAHMDGTRLALFYSPPAWIWTVGLKIIPFRYLKNCKASC